MKRNFTTKTLLIVALSAVMMAAGSAVKNASGPPASKTNAPGETNCTDGGCHSSFSLNPTQANLTNLTLTTGFTGNGYIPDSTYTLTLSYSQSGIGRFGFQITCLTKSGNNPAGTFTAGTGSQKITGTIFSKTREYIEHTSGGISGSGSKSWTFTWKAPSTNVDSIVFYAVVNAANGDGTNSGDEIYAKEFKFGPSSLLPVASISASKTTVCVGDTVYFTGSGTNSPTSYSWKFQRGTPSTSSSATPAIVYNLAGTSNDTLRVFNAKGGSVPKAIQITVLSKPNPNIVLITPNDTICDGDSTVLTATFVSGGQYQWNTGNPLDNQQTLVVKQSGSYSVTVTNSGGCKGTSPAVNIVVKPKPVVSLVSSAVNDSACSTDNVVFTATAGHDTYNFMLNGVTKQNNSSNTYTTKLASGDVVSVIATKNGCASLVADKTLVVVSPLQAPVISCGTATTSSVAFSWNAVAGATGYEVSTNNGANWNAPSSGANGTSHQVNGLGFSTNVTLMVRALSNGPCAVGASGQQSCSSLPCSGVTFNTIIGDTLVCPGDSTTITIGNISAASYSLKFNNGAYGTDTIFWVKPNATTDYPFELVDSANLVCPPAAFNAQVKVDNVPALNVGYNPANAVCQGAPVQITSSAGFATYTLYVNGSPSAMTNSTGLFSYSTVAAGVPINVVSATANGCGASSPDKTFTVNPLPNVGFTASVNNKAVTFDDTTSNALSRDWDFGDNNGTSTVKNPTYTYATVGTFDVKLIVKDVNQCMDSASQQVTTTNVSTGEIDGLNGLEVYPNPTTGKVKLDLNWQGTGIITIKVTDITGRIISTETIAESGALSREINLMSLPGGTYLVHIQAEGGEKVIKLLKQDK